MINLQKEILNCLSEWYHSIESEMNFKGIFVFGSLIHSEGKLFDRDQSDIDMVCIFPDSISSAPERANWIFKFENYKATLELEVAKILKRNVVKPIISIIPITNIELMFDIHKSGVRNFLRENIFYDLNSGVMKNGISNDQTKTLLDESVRQLFETSQSARNKYLSISYIHKGNPLDCHSEEDFLPKELLRKSAIASYLQSKMESIEEKTDITIGLSHLVGYVYMRRHEDILYSKVHDVLSRRAAGKGEKPKLNGKDYLFISEIICDMALSQIPISIIEESSENDIQSDESARNHESAIECRFIIGKNGIIRGKTSDIKNDIYNAGVNLAWRTPPYFSCYLEEIQMLEIKIQKNPKDGRSIDKLRRLKKIEHELFEGYSLIIYFQNHLLPFSKDILSDVFTALQYFTFTVISKHIHKSGIKGVEEGILESYIPQYIDYSETYPSIKIRPVIKFGLPDKYLDGYLKSNKMLCKKSEVPNIFTLAAFNQPLNTIPSALIAQFFIPLFIKKIVENELTAFPVEDEQIKFIYDITNLSKWFFGVN